MNRTPLELTPIGKNTINAKKPPLDLNSIGTKTLDPKPLTLSTEYSKHKEKSQKEYIPEDMESYPPSSDSSLSKYDSSNDSK